MSVDDVRPMIDEDAGYLTLEDGYRLMWAVNADGSRTPWLMASLCAHCEGEATHGNWRDALHELEGPIPPHVRRRLFGDLRCGAPTAVGRPCRQRVTHLGEQCAAHADVGAGR